MIRDAVHRQVIPALRELPTPLPRVRLERPGPKRNEVLRAVNDPGARWRDERGQAMARQVELTEVHENEPLVTGVSHPCRSSDHRLYRQVIRRHDLAIVHPVFRYHILETDS